MVTIPLLRQGQMIATVNPALALARIGNKEDEAFELQNIQCNPWQSGRKLEATGYVNENE
jgi:hypothetical protein